MVIERLHGNALVPLGPKLQACPVEIIRQRRDCHGHTEYLIRWAILSLENDTGSGIGAPSTDSRTENILMWMSSDEVYANCPTLLGERRKKEKTSSVFPPDVKLDETSLSEMEVDIRNLVQRATLQMSSVVVPHPSILNTIHVLSAYAGIGSLTSVFKETGALDLLMKMLCNEEKQIRRSASKMLRALASHDTGSRAYVLLSLSQQDGIEQHMDFDSRYTLLELFAETASSEENLMPFEEIPLPQIPGKLLFSLVKRYLFASSLMDKLNSIKELDGECEHSVPSNAVLGRSRKLQCEFDFSMAMANFILELVRAMDWDRRREHRSLNEGQPQIVQSIFKPQIPSCTAAPPATLLTHKGPSTFKPRSAFPSRSSYTEYMQEKLVHGMRVRMLENYEKVSAGDEGEFLQSNNGTPPVQIYWEALGRTYWVHWHMIEIVGASCHAEQKAQEKVSNLTDSLRQDAVNQKIYHKPLVGLYSLPYLPDPVNESPETLSRAEWWEILFFVKKLDQQQQQELLQFIQQNQKLSELDEGGLIQLSVSRDLALQLLRILSEHCHGCTQSDLRRSHVYLKYFSGKEGTEQNSPKRGVPSVKCGGSPKAMASEKPKKGLLSKVSLPGLPTAQKTDTQLTVELLRLEGISLPSALDEKAKAFCSVTVSGKKNILEQLADALELIQKSCCDTELQITGLRFMTKTLEETAGQEKQVIKAEMEHALREKIVKMLVEVLSQQMKKKLYVGLALQVVYGLLAKYDWRVLFATQGGLHAVLLRMKEHSESALVQQAGLAVLKVLLGAGKCDLPGSCGKAYPLDHTSTQTIQAIFSSIGSTSSKDTDSLLYVIPAAVEKMLSIPGASTAVQNGLLVLNKLISNHSVLAELVGRCNLQSLLQRCCQEGQSFNEALAQIVLSHLAENSPSLGQETADPTASLPRKDISVSKLLNSLHANHTFKELGVILEHSLSGMAAQPQENSYELLADALLLEDVVQLGPEKEMLLGMLRLLNKFLDKWQDDLVRWHKCIEPCLSSLSAHINDKEIVQESIGFLQRLATLNKDCAVMMSCMNTADILTKISEKHGTSLMQLTELRELLSQCEKYASLYKKMTVSILAGCIQMVLDQIEEHRRGRQPVNIPFFDVLLRNLCQGCCTEVKEEKCWEKVEVSSNPQQASKLMDGNPKTYWESNGSTGSHYINIYMHRGVIVQQMSLLVASEDSSYMPSRVMVMGGESTSSITTKLNMVNVPPLASRVIILENLSHFWPIIQIKIKCCRQGGVDTRVRGIEVLGPKPTFWPIFKEQLCRRTFLFYTTKARAWCQEISEDRMQLLQLFNRLNSALRHEQVFADRFLPDDEAAQALGKTCWEALINPLVQSITSLDASGISPLSWLLNEYLENMEAARSSRTRAAIFNSRVRRLSHLLVHVDSSSPEAEELKPPIKSNGKNKKNKESNSGAVKATGKKPNSTTGITQCWKGVIQEQVKRFLESSWQAPDFVERYCNTYLRLRTAMEELFGQQMSFMLALRHGFSGGLLHLSFSTAMHVSEQFARYIDMWIQKSWSDSGNVETLRRLQQSLEPILFLAGLELANTFEHFYRYYLGDRLLSQGRTWLECAVVDHIGLCFPNRFPQQMLKNLSELEEQQQQFHLFQLQQLDKHLLELDQDGKCKEEELGKMMEEQPFSEDPEVEVKVLALSPGCWTISPLCYLEEPANFFPSSLSQHLSKFADFYTQSHRPSVLEDPKPQCLQWTWLGYAELQYQACILHVSTLQMYILLGFNSAEVLSLLEISVDTLLRITKLSPSLVQCALQPLTKKGILTQSQDVLKLNEGVLAQGSGQCLRLLPKQMHLSVGGDEGSSLEEKKKIICCLLIQVLKGEKEMHIDNLVFKVIDGCQKARGGPGPNTLSCFCSSADVLSCILHLLNEGSIRRQKTCPEYLEYVCTEHPMLAVPKNQRQVTFQTMQIKKAPTVLSTEKKQTFSTFR